MKVSPEITKSIVMAKTNFKLQLELYQEYFDAILANNPELVENKLNSVSGEERVALLDGSFTLNDIDCPYMSFGTVRGKPYRISKPFHLAVALSSLYVAEVMIRYRVDVLGCDETGHNVMHSLVSAVRLLSIPEDCTAHEWLLDRLDSDTVTQLMMNENYNGFRPLEYAVQQDCLKLFNSFLHTPGCYLKKEEIHGIALWKYVDISEYETGTRHIKSPMLLLVCMSKSKVKDKSSIDLLKLPLINAWMQAKISCNRPLSLIWFLIRFFTLCSFLFFDRDASLFIKNNGDDINSNTTLCNEALTVNMTTSTKTAIGSVIYVISCLGVFCDIFEFVRSFIKGLKARNFDLKGQKESALNCKFYKLSHLVMNLTLITVIPIMFTMSTKRYYSKENETVRLYVDIARATLPLTMMWSILYFIRGLPSIGNAVLSIQSMLGDMIHFFVLYSLLLLPFIHSFLVFITFNSREGCIDDFRDTLTSAYSLFKMMLNMIDLAQYNVKHVGVVYGMHILYVFLVAILLLNFLIAVMSTSAAGTAEHHRILMILGRLRIATTIEERLHWLARRYYYLVHKRYFCVEGNRVYLRVAINRLESFTRQNEKLNAGTVPEKKTRATQTLAEDITSE